MKLIATPLVGGYEIEMDTKGDERGFFARLFCSREWMLSGLENTIVQINNSFSAEKGTLRGLHYQHPPAAETKIVRCIQGALWDVMVDLREESPTYLQWHGVVLSAHNRKMLYVPQRFAHGFITLEANTELLYFVTEGYAPQHEAAIRWNDPAIHISWPLEPTLISEKDRNTPDFQTSLGHSS